MENLLTSNEIHDETVSSCTNSTSNEKTVTVHNGHVTENLHQCTSNDFSNSTSKELFATPFRKHTSQCHTSGVSKSELHKKVSICTEPQADRKKSVNNASAFRNISVNQSMQMCTACHKVFLQKMCVLFKRCNYDFKNEIVSNTLAREKRFKQLGAPESICKNCHKILRVNPHKGNSCISEKRSCNTESNISQHFPVDNTQRRKSLGEQNCHEISVNMNHEENVLCVCKCCHRTFERKLCIEFVKDNYDYSSDIVSHTLSDDIRYKCRGMLEYICKICDQQLNKNNNTPVIPCEAVASPQKGLFMCLLCDHHGSRRYAHEFDESNYNSVVRA